MIYKIIFFYAQVLVLLVMPSSDKVLDPSSTTTLTATLTILIWTTAALLLLLNFSASISRTPVYSAMLCVTITMSVLSAVAHLTRAVLKSARTVSGVQSVTILLTSSGALKMLVWYADSSTCLYQVSIQLI